LFEHDQVFRAIISATEMADGQAFDCL
jgi:hypothetical protein